MSHKSCRSAEVKTPIAIVSFADNLFEAREDKWKNKSYQCTLHFAKGTDISTLEKAAVEAATAAWPGKPIADWIKEGVIKNPFLDGDGKQGKDKDGKPKPGHAGTRFIRCKSGVEYPPTIVNGKKLPVAAKSECPSGSQVYAVVNAFTWENDEQGKGLTFGISLVQVVKKAVGDEILGGGGNSADPDKFFETIADEGDAPAETKTGAGAGGLFG